jgi:hypothetical protein
MTWLAFAPLPFGSGKHEIYERPLPWRPPLRQTPLAPEVRKPGLPATKAKAEVSK